ncbi:MAG: SDR family oxidoreductase [Deltaproteobacteria bacterium]|nr:SDR family oxidoreductase [Deltaproteobacteria bacterium]
MNLKDKRIVIIGGTSGLGLATARAAAVRGAEVVIGGRHYEKLEKAKKEIGGKVEGLTLDVGDEGEIKAFFEWVGKFDHLTTPGSTAHGGPFLTLDTASAQADFQSKFWGQYLAAKYGAPRLRPGGSIVFFAGMWSQRPPAGVATFAAINSAIEGLARALAVELAPIRVNAVSPGLVDTPIYSGMPATQKEAMFKAFAATAPVKRVGRPEEVAQTVLYLMTNPFTTGSTLYVDGGYLLR